MVYAINATKQSLVRLLKEKKSVKIDKSVKGDFDKMIKGKKYGK